MKMFMIIRIVVLLPAPFGPSKPKIPPRATVIDKFFTAVCPANRLVTPLTAITVSAIWPSLSLR